MLTGERITLRNLEPMDAEHFFRWHIDHEFSVLDGVPYPTSRGAWDEFLASAAKPSSTSVILGIEIEPQKLIGYISLKRVRAEDRSADFGIAIAREFWDQHYGRDATQTLLRFAFMEMNLHRVSLSVADYNVRARRMYESCGFIEEGRLREALFRDGRYHDNIVMAILDREFFERSPSRSTEIERI